MNTYSVTFNDDTNSDNAGINFTKEEAVRYLVNRNVGKNACGFFKCYKGGTVAVVCNETGETIYSEEIL